MSRVRVRPTREETRQRLFDAAAGVFERQGIGAASVEDIVDAAGFSRGAFYSNFAGKDELIVAMLADHVERTVRYHLELLARYRDPADFVAALRAAERGEHDPLGRSPLLHIELILYAARNVRNHPELADSLRARRALVTQILTDTDIDIDIDIDTETDTETGNASDGPMDPARMAAMLLAMEDGFRLHRLIDPDTTPPDSFIAAVTDLQTALGLTQRH